MARTFSFRTTAVLALGVLIGFGASFWLRERLNAEDKEKRDDLKAQLKKLDLSAFKAYSIVAKLTRPSVVNIRVTRQVMKLVPGQADDDLDKLFLERFEAQAQGSGVIMSDQGYILTNYHVVNNATLILVQLHDKRILLAKRIGSDEKTDLAVIQVKADGLVPAMLGDSNQMEIGDKVLAVGSPFNLEQTVTEGIVSAKGRELNLRDDAYEDYIQTDAAINPGNSGGALVNLKGEVIGINTAILSKTGSSAGIGFAIPVNMAKEVYQALSTTGKVERGWIGVQISDVTQSVSARLKYPSLEGVLVAKVVDDGPAKEAGLMGDDVIFKFADKKVTDANDLRNAVALTHPGQKVSIEIFREGKIKILEMKIAPQKAEKEK